MNYSAHDNQRSHLPCDHNAQPRFWVGNTVRGLLLVVDVVIGAVLASVGVRYVLIPLDEGGPFSIDLPTGVLCVISAALGIGMVGAGVLLLALKRPRCWQTGVRTHRRIAVGILLFIPAMIYDAQYAMQVRPGHAAGEAAMGTVVISILVAILASLWFFAAALLFQFQRSDQQHFPTDEQSPSP